TDQPIIARLKRIGFDVGKSFDIDKLDPAVKKALEAAPEDARKLMAWKMPTLARVANYWSMNTDTMGVYSVRLPAWRERPQVARPTLIKKSRNPRVGAQQAKCIIVARDPQETNLLCQILRHWESVRVRHPPHP